MKRLYFIIVLLLGLGAATGQSMASKNNNLSDEVSGKELINHKTVLPIEKLSKKAMDIYNACVSYNHNQDKGSFRTLCEKEISEESIERAYELFGNPNNKKDKGEVNEELEIYTQNNPLCEKEIKALKMTIEMLGYMKVAPQNSFLHLSNFATILLGLGLPEDSIHVWNQIAISFPIKYEHLKPYLFIVSMQGEAGV